MAKRIEVADPETTEKPKQEMIRAYKVNNDVQTWFCGVRVQIDEHGKEYFELPPYAKNLVDQHINLVWPAEAE